MTFIKSIGKQCKSRFMHLTEAEAGMVCVGAALFNVLLIALWIWS
jgi:heme/copper-type cytochrome/quinol oxidase subunit 4